MGMDKAARRILWGSYLFQFWISGADFVQDQEGDKPLPLCILMGGRLGRESEEKDSNHFSSGPGS